MVFRHATHFFVISFLILEGISHLLKTLVLQCLKIPNSVSSLKKIPNVEYFYVKNGASIFLKSESFWGIFRHYDMWPFSKKKLFKVFQTKVSISFQLENKKLFRPLCFYSLKRRFFQWHIANSIIFFSDRHTQNVKEGGKKNTEFHSQF